MAAMVDADDDDDEDDEDDEEDGFDVEDEWPLRVFR